MSIFNSGSIKISDEDYSIDCLRKRPQVASSMSPFRSHQYAWLRVLMPF